MKTKSLFLTLVLLAIGGSLFGQTLTPAASSTGSITVNAANCNTTNACIILHMASSNVGYSVTVSGTWTGTLTVEQSGDNQGSWTSATTTTANTLFTSALTPGITDARVRGSAAMTGTAVVTITASGPATLQQITQIGSGSSASFLNGSIIDATATTYNLKYNAVWVIDATFNGTTTVQTGASDPCFVSATDAGKQIEGTTWTGADAAYRASVLTLAETTIASVTDCHHAVVTAGTPGACAAVCTLGWGTKDDTAIAAIWTAATGSPGLCKTIWWPSAAMWNDIPQFQSVSCNNPITGTPRTGMAFIGQGGHEAGTVFILGSTFNLASASCVTSCFFGSLTGIKMSGFAIFGLGNPVGGNQAAVMLAPNTDDEVDDVELAGYGATDTGLSCTSLNNVDVRWLIVDGCGYVNNATGHVGLHQAFFGNGGNAPLICGSSAGYHVESHGSGYQVAPAQTGVPNVTLNNGCNFLSTGDVNVGVSTTNAVCVQANAGSTAYIEGMNCDLSASTGATGYWAHGGKIVVAFGIIGGATNAVLVDTSGTFIDATPSVTKYTGGPVTVTSGCASGDVALLACANLTAQGANIGATTLITTGAAITFNDYTLYYDAWVTTIGTGTLTVNLICPNGTATVTQAGAATVAMTGNNEGSGALSCHAATSSAIQYSVTGFTTGAYALNLRLVGK